MADDIPDEARAAAFKALGDRWVMMDGHQLDQMVDVVLEVAAPLIAARVRADTANQIADELLTFATAPEDNGEWGSSWNSSHEHAAEVARGFGGSDG